MSTVTPAGRRFLAALAADAEVQLRRTAGARPRFYLLKPGKLWRPTGPVNQQMADALSRGGFIAQVEQTGQDLPHAVDRVTAPFIWALTGAAHEVLAQASAGATTPTAGE